MFIEHNALSGALPPELALMTALTSLRLDFNNFSGPIPPEMFGLGQVRPQRCTWRAPHALAAAPPPRRARQGAPHLMYMKSSKNMIKPCKTP